MLHLVVGPKPPHQHSPRAEVWQPLPPDMGHGHLPPDIWQRLPPDIWRRLPPRTISVRGMPVAAPGVGALELLKKILRLTEAELIHLRRRFRDAAKFEDFIMCHPDRDLFMKEDVVSGLKGPCAEFKASLRALHALALPQGAKKQPPKATAAPSTHTAVDLVTVTFSRDVPLSYQDLVKNPGTVFKDIIPPEVNDRWAIIIKLEPFRKALEIYNWIVQDTDVPLQTRTTNAIEHITGVVQLYKLGDLAEELG